MIVGISGVAGSGKDTVADLFVQKHGFVKVALADPLKRICRDVYAFTDDQLWGPSESRNAPDKRYPRGTGVAVADPDENGIRGAQFQPVYLTPRLALQLLGTEWGRVCYDNTWVDLAIRTAQSLLKKDYVANERIYRYTMRRGLFLDEGRSFVPHGDEVSSAVMGVDLRNHLPAGVVISDVRFHNEVAAIKKAGGKLVRVIRPGAGLASDAGQHVSETQQKEIPDTAFDFVIDNNSSLHMLELLVDRTMAWLTGRIRNYSEAEQDIPPAFRK